MTRKHDVVRPYPPDLCSAETLAYRLDISRSTFDDYIRLGHLPRPLEIGTQRRWRWVDIEAWIAARNGLDAVPIDPLNSEAGDPYIRGLANAKASHA
jgi:predicted DNA-binding transcriptional regulator AlpA